MRKDLTIPRKLMEEQPYCNMSEKSRELYVGLLVMKETMSGAKCWIDRHGFRYLVVPKKELQSLLECSRYKVDKYTRELELMGLIWLEYVGPPRFERRIYVRNFDPRPDDVKVGYVECSEGTGTDNPCDHSQAGDGHSTVMEPGRKDADKGKADPGDKTVKGTNGAQKTDCGEYDPRVELFFARVSIRNISKLVSKLEEKLEEINENME